MNNPPVDGVPNERRPRRVRVDDLGARCLTGVAKGFAESSRLFVEQLSRDRRAVALPASTVTAFFQANAHFLKALSAVVRDTADRVDGRAHPTEWVGQDDFELAARWISERMDTGVKAT